MAAVRLEDVARLAGVSMKTVSNVVHNYPHVSASTRKKVEAAIAESGYRPNASARRLATGKTGMLALAFADVSLPYFAELARVISRLASERGYRLLLEQTYGDLDLERDILSSREAGLVDGVIFQPSRMSSLDIAQRHEGLPLVLLGEGAVPLSVDHVMIDNSAAAVEATRHLLALGRRRIGFVGHEEIGQSVTSMHRLMGFQHALDTADVPLDMSLLMPSVTITAQDAAASVRRALAEGLQFDGLVCRDDLAAIGALRALHEHGLRVPDDVAVVGWDNIAIASSTYPTLTSIAPDTTLLSARALDMLEERIGGYTGLGRHLITAHSLVVRESAPVAE